MINGLGNRPLLREQQLICIKATYTKTESVCDMQLCIILRKYIFEYYCEVLILFKINAILYNFLFIKQSWKKQHCFYKNIKQQNICITRISEISCDTEVWTNSCWKLNFSTTGINYISKYIKKENSYCKL